MTDIYALTDSAILRQIGQRLKEERLAQNVSQVELSRKSGLAQSSISLIEKGKNGSLLSVVSLLRALNRLDVLSELFEEKPISPIAYSEMMRKMKVRKNASPKKKSEGEVLEEDDFNWDK